MEEKDFDRFDQIPENYEEYLSPRPNRISGADAIERAKHNREVWRCDHEFQMFVEPQSAEDFQQRQSRERDLEIRAEKKRERKEKKDEEMKKKGNKRQRRMETVRLANAHLNSVSSDVEDIFTFDEEDREMIGQFGTNTRKEEFNASNNGSDNDDEDIFGPDTDSEGETKEDQNCEEIDES